MVSSRFHTMWPSLYHSLECEEFHAERKRRSFLNACLKTVGILYGIAPLGIVLEMLNQDMGSSWTEDRIKRSDCLYPIRIAFLCHRGG